MAPPRNDGIASARASKNVSGRGGDDSPDEIRKRGLEKLPRRDDAEQESGTRRREIKCHGASGRYPNGRGDAGRVSKEVVKRRGGTDDEVEVGGVEAGHGEDLFGGGYAQRAQGLRLLLLLAVLPFDCIDDGNGAPVEEYVALADAGPAADPFVGGVVHGFEFGVGDDGDRGGGPDADGAHSQPPTRCHV